MNRAESNNLSWIFVDKKDIKKARGLHRGHILRETFFSKSFQSRNDEYMTSQLGIPSLDGSCYELIVSTNEVSYQKDGPIHVSSDGRYSLLRMEVEEREMGTEVSVYRAYQKIFQRIEADNMGHLVRIWNFIPQLLTQDQNLERYRQFNIGRNMAWKDFGPKNDNGEPASPAATGIGAADGPIVIECLVSKIPVLHLQNPRQTPAHLYSQRFGPKPPVFSRATVCFDKISPLVFISGTASLVGEDVMWKGDPEKQTKEALYNISVLISKKNFSNYGLDIGLTLNNLESVRVYIKNKTDYPLIKGCVESAINPEKAIYLNNDICRPDFLVEIEGIARS